MIIVAGGDSFVYGSELSDCKDNVPADIYGHSYSTFAALLAKDTDYKCVAWPGYANDSIARTTIAECNKYAQCGVIVSWTFSGRYEFRFNYNTGQRKSPWYAFNSWTLEQPDNIIKQFNKTDNYIAEVFIKHHANAKDIGILDFVKTFYNHVGNSEYWEIYSGLKEIVYLQNYLKVRNIPYMFTCADNSILYNYTCDHADEFISSLLNQIDMNNWFWFPAGTKDNETKTPRGFYQWALENKYPIGTTHPLDQAHADAAKLIQEKFNDMVTKHLE
jgi:hypothetical protein